jgi:copper chaperone CopZ
MEKIILAVEGMMCGMCESHINDSVRAAFPVKKVTSSHTKGQTVILTEQDIDEDALLKVIDKTGYMVISVTKESYEKKGLFSFGKFSKNDKNYHYNR